MAAIQNERDIDLQAAPERLLEIPLPDNFKVDFDNVFGAGALASLDFVDAETQVTNLGDLAFADTILANQIGAGTLPVDVIYANTILPSQIGSGTLPVNVIYAGTILTSQIGSGTLPAGVIYAGEINANQVNSGSFSGETFTGGVFNGAQILGSQEISVVNNGDFTLQGVGATGKLYKLAYNGVTGVMDMDVTLNQYGPSSFNTITTTGNSALGAALSVQNRITAYGGITTHANSTFNGNITISGGTFSVSGSSTFSSGVNINGNVGGTNNLPIRDGSTWYYAWIREGSSDKSVQIRFDAPI